jgi:hypothetical protein
MSKVAASVPVKATFVWLLISAMEWETERVGDMYPNKRVWTKHIIIIV